MHSTPSFRHRNKIVPTTHASLLVCCTLTTKKDNHNRGSTYSRAQTTPEGSERSATNVARRAPAIGWALLATEHPSKASKKSPVPFWKNRSPPPPVSVTAAPLSSAPGRVRCVVGGDRLPDADEPTSPSSFLMRDTDPEKKHHCSCCKRCQIFWC